MCLFALGSRIHRNIYLDYWHRMIDFKTVDGFLILAYENERGDNEWVYRRLEQEGYIYLKSTFNLTKDYLWDSSNSVSDNIFSPDMSNSVNFKIAVKSGEYYEFFKNILQMENGLYIHETIGLSYKTFTAHSNVSIFRKFDRIANTDIYIGGNNENCIPKKDFTNLIKNFPNSYEIDKYVLARVGSVIRTYMETKIDAGEKYRNYINKKLSVMGNDLFTYFSEYETFKYESICHKLKEMLDNEISYSEHQWQDEILQIILIIFPKYIQAFKSAPVRDVYSEKNRQIDILLVDTTGNTDIVEIKKPFDECIVTNGTYRDNYIPRRELSGTVMQVEKYIFYLNKCGKKGEDILTKKYKNELPDNFQIRITNPNGLIIMGRSNNLTPLQKQDFEVLKRKYKHVVDILTYDDLIDRLNHMISHWKGDK